MKWFRLTTIFMLMLGISSQVFAQTVCRDATGTTIPCPTATPDAGNNDRGRHDIPDDTDGDGTADPLDACPTEPGDGANSGCPPGTDPNNPGSSAVPPFSPPLLSNSACYVTSNGDYLARVRVAPDVATEHIGNLNPGQIYPAIGVVMENGQSWIKLAGEFEHLNYEMWGGTDGYVSDSVVHKSNCPELDSYDMRAVRPVSPLCHLTVGYDAPIWGEGAFVTAGHSITYASFWFAAEPGEPIPEGTASSGVIFLANFIILDDPLLQVAVAPDAALFAEASNAEYAGDYNWPTMYGGIQSGDKTLYRLSPPYNTGACGPIVGIDDFVAAGGVIPQTLEAFRDCNGNGIDDLDEFWPPDCFELTTETTGQSGALARLSVIHHDGNDEPESEEGVDWIEICVWLEVHEAGVYEEYCYEYYPPEGCIFVQGAEAGMWELDCDPVSLNPDLFPIAIGFPLLQQAQNTAGYELDDADIAANDMMCPDGWIYIPSTKEFDCA